MKLQICLVLAALAVAGCQAVGQQGTTGAPSASMRQNVEVRDVQTALRKLGYYRGGVDGIVGPVTRAAIRQSQSDFGLPVTGEADGRLLDQAERHLRYNAPHRDLPTAAEVFALQRALARLGYYKGPKDGRYVGETLKALLDYQRANGLKINHKRDPRLLRRIEREAGTASS